MRDFHRVTRIASSCPHSTGTLTTTNKRLHTFAGLGCPGLRKRLATCMRSLVVCCAHRLAVTCYPTEIACGVDHPYSGTLRG